MKTISELLASLELYGFHVEAGRLEHCVEWLELKRHINTMLDCGDKPATESQHSIMLWAEETFGTEITPGRAALRSLEEMVELCIEVGLQSDQIAAQVVDAIGAALEKRKGIEKAPEELADVYITLCRLAYALGKPERRVPRAQPVDIQAEVDRKMQVNRARKWAFDGQGSGQHIEEHDDGGA